MEASQNGHVAVVTILLEAGAKVDGGKSSVSFDCDFLIS
jgi:hypothetical protein